MTTPFTAILYTDRDITRGLYDYCYRALRDQLHKDFPYSKLVVSSQFPLPLPNNVVVDPATLSPYHALRIYSQILAALPLSTGPLLLCEQDVLYPSSHFVSAIQELGDGGIVYNSNVVHLTRRGFEESNFPHFLSTCCCDRISLEEGIKAKLEEFENLGRVIHCEIGIGLSTNLRLFTGPDPILDIRHGANLTGDRDTGNYLQSNEFWGDYFVLAEKIFS